MPISGRYRLKVPPCTPLNIAAGDKGRGKSADVENERWGRMRVERDVLDTVHPEFAACLAASDAYRGRFTEEQIATFEAGELVAGMPIEFALMVLGPGCKTIRNPESARRPSKSKK